MGIVTTMIFMCRKNIEIQNGEKGFGCWAYYMGRLINNLISSIIVLSLTICWSFRYLIVQVLDPALDKNTIEENLYILSKYPDMLFWICVGEFVLCVLWLLHLAQSTFWQRLYIDSFDDILKKNEMAKNY